jgi:hypothetical protein
VIKVEINFFYNSGGWESDGSGRVAGNDGADSMLQFWLERRGDGTKRCRKMKRSQSAHHGSMGRKHDTAQRCGNVSRRRDDAREGKGRR